MIDIVYTNTKQIGELIKIVTELSKKVDDLTKQIEKKQSYSHYNINMGESL